MKFTKVTQAHSFLFALLLGALTIQDTSWAGSVPSHTEIVSDVAGVSTWVEHRYGTFNGQTLHYVKGPTFEGSPTVVLLHGYPEYWYAWRNQIAFLAHQGINVVAPDLRGFGNSSKPRGVGAYSTRWVAKDIAHLIDHVSPNQPVILVGHDWGGSVAWQLAYDEPHLVASLLVLNIPHPRQLREILRHPFQHPKEFLSSAYVVFMGLPLLPEFVLTRVLGYERAFDLFMGKGLAHPENFPADERARLIESWKIPGALESATDYYRDNQAYFKKLPDEPLNRPVHLVFGKQDKFMSPLFLNTFTEFQPNAQVHAVEDGGHFIEHDRYDLVNQVILKAVNELH